MEKVLQALAVLLIIYSCGNSSKDNGGGKGGPPGAQQQNQVRPFAVIPVKRQMATLLSDFPANIQGQQNIEIRPKINGYMGKIYVDEGAVVKKGQLMFEINAPEYEQDVRTAAANVKIAMADVDAARMNVSKVRPLVERNIVSKYELESAQYTLESKEAALTQARANLTNAQINLGYTKIYSPVDGVVGSIPYRLGSLVSSTTAEPLTTVSNIGTIYAYFAISENQLLSFSKNTGPMTNAKLGQFPDVQLLLSNGTAYPLKGRIETVNGLINPQTGSANVRAVFPNPNYLIRSGSSATVRVPQYIDTAILVPQEATYELQGKRFVYVVPDTSGVVRSVEITVNPISVGHAFVVQSGLKPGDMVVVEGVGSLHDKTKIKPKMVSTDSVYQAITK